MAKAKANDPVAQEDAGEDTPKKSSAPKGPELTGKLITKRYEDARQDTESARVNYWLNRAFVYGDQWLYSKRGEGSSEIVPVPATAKKRREQATLNKMESPVHNTVSRIMKVPFQFEVMAQSADDHALKGAQTGESVIRHKAVRDEWSVKMEDAITATILGGTAGIATHWDPEANEYSPEIQTGDAYLSVLSIEDFVIQCGALDPRTATWWVQKQILHPEVVQETYGLEEEPPADDTSGGMFSANAIKYSSNLTSRQGTRVLTYFERPNKMRPEGAVVVVVNNAAVHRSAWPFPFRDHLNLEVMVCIRDSESWLGETYVTQARSPQRQINHLATKFHENFNRTVGSKLMLDQQHAELNKQLDDDPEVPLIVSGNQAIREPSYLDPPKMPPFAAQYYELLSGELDDIMGVHAISRGETPANSPDSGFGLSLLAEQDATPAGRLTKEVARVFPASATNILELYQFKVKDKRTGVTTRGRGKSVRPFSWVGKDLAGQTTVTIPPDSVLPRNHAGILKMGMDLLQYKGEWFLTPESWISFVEQSGLEHMSQIFDGNTALAEYENYWIGEGQQVETNEFDDDAKHIQQHNEERMSPDYRSWPEERKRFMELHIANHKAQVESKEGQAAAAAALRQIATGGGIGLPQEATAAAPQAGPPSTPQALAPSPSALTPQIPEQGEPQ